MSDSILMSACSCGLFTHIQQTEHMHIFYNKTLDQFVWLIKSTTFLFIIECNVFYIMVLCSYALTVLFTIYSGQRIYTQVYLPYIEIVYLSYKFNNPAFADK